MTTSRRRLTDTSNPAPDIGTDYKVKATSKIEIEDGKKTVAKVTAK